MFYSETLLSKTGPLARVWLSANIERKVNRNQILSSNIQDSVNAIVDQGQAPLALRLSGQLLLGVVRIYSRKARYLLDDCNEALHKIKMTFRSGNVDLPANQTSTANPASLTLPDVLTELDLLAPLPDPSLLLSQPFDDLLDGPDPNLLDFGSSQRLTSTMQRARRESTEPLQLEDDMGLNLDLGNDIDTTFATERDIEVGRDAPPARSLAEDFDDTLKLDDGNDLILDLGDDEPMVHQESTLLPEIRDTNLGQDIPMAGFEDDGGFDLPMMDLASTSAPLRRDQRESLSPLSSIRSSTERELERTVHENQKQNQTTRPSIFAEPTATSPADDEPSVHQAQRAKRRKVLQPDTETELHSNQIRAQQNDRSKILKPASYIPRDPLLLALMNMQKNGEFVSNILSDGRSKGWAPELRGILSLEIIRTPLKRKRDTLAASATQAEAGAPTPSPSRPQILIPPEAADDLVLPSDNLAPDADVTLDLPSTAKPTATSPVRSASEPQDDNDTAMDMLPALTTYEDEDAANNAPLDDEPLPPSTTSPTATGPISLGTKHAVHLLRERFGTDNTATATPSRRAKAGVLFQDLLPPQSTSRADATKMFFEVLVLATKDAVAVEQDAGKENKGGGVVGAPLRVRAKRGLWGVWAERGTEEEEEEGDGQVQDAPTARGAAHDVEVAAA